jgi:hypothetical protein
MELKDQLVKEKNNYSVSTCWFLKLSLGKLVLALLIYGVLLPEAYCLMLLSTCLSLCIMFTNSKWWIF